MKFFILISFIALSLSSQAQAQELKIQKIKTIGVMKNKVIFQSLNVKKIKKTNVVKGKVVAMWGTQVYEVLEAYYACQSNNVCKLSDFDRLATYESCEVSKKSVKCKNKISGNDITINQSDLSYTSGPDDVSDDFSNARTYDENAEFPERIQGEFADIF